MMLMLVLRLVLRLPGRALLCLFFCSAQPFRFEQVANWLRRYCCGGCASRGMDGGMDGWMGRYMRYPFDYKGIYVR
jgi:hypothetical protein